MSDKNHSKTRVRPLKDYKKFSKDRLEEIEQNLAQATSDNNTLQIKIWTDVLNKLKSKKK